MIARIWRGVVRRDEDDRTEFITFTLWDSVEAVKAFAGEDEVVDEG
jgi:heme-degrading monooxygenase HmoA